MDKPLSLDQHFQNYETLAQAVADETQRGQIVDYEEAKGKIRQLMSELGVRRVRHDQNGAFVLLSGQSNIITGQISYLYKLGDAEIDLSMHARDGITRDVNLWRLARRLLSGWKEDISAMRAHKPEECDRLLFEVIETGNLDAALELYEQDAIFVVSSDQVVSGHAAIRRVLQNMIAANATGKLDSITAVPSSDGTVAFTRAKGSSTGPGPDGTLVTTHFHSIEIVRKQPDGTWRIIIDDPSGVGLQ